MDAVFFKFLKEMSLGIFFILAMFALILLLSGILLGRMFTNIFRAFE